jgi:hypothetical protein
MRCTGFLTLALLALLGVAGGPVFAATCQAGRLICATTMPVGGYCQCTAHGKTEDGTVVSRPPQHTSVNSTAGGCGAQPNAPGCR